MTRFLLLLLTLSSITAQAQTYVRPSKGASFSPFTDTGLDGGWYIPLQPVLANVSVAGPIYDWTAFEAVRIRVYPVTNGIGPDGGLHSLDRNSIGTLCSGQSYQYTADQLGSYVRFTRSSSALRDGTYLSVWDAPTVSGPFALSSGTNNQINLQVSEYGLSNFYGCWVRIQVTPIPFAPLVSGSTEVTLPDGGISVTTDRTCTTVKMATTQVPTSALVIPADGGLSGRWYERVCNSVRNSGTPIITCTSDGQTPTTAATSSGESLEVGDCATYLTTNDIMCISDTAATQVSSEECQ